MSVWAQMAILHGHRRVGLGRVMLIHALYLDTQLDGLTEHINVVRRLRRGGHDAGAARHSKRSPERQSIN